MITIITTQHNNIKSHYKYEWESFLYTFIHFLFFFITITSKIMILLNPRFGIEIVIRLGGIHVMYLKYKMEL